MKKGLFLLFLSFAVWHINTIGQSCGSTNIALSKAVSASSYKDQFSVPEYAVDGNLTTNWKSGAVGVQWITVDLGQAYTVCRVKLSWAANYTFPTTVQIFVSDAATGGTSVYSSSSAGNALDYTLSTATSGRYVRIEMSVPYATWAAHYELNEFEIYAGTGNTPPTVSISSPSPNTSFTVGSNIVIDANAADADGTVTKVEFFEGTNKLGEDLDAPYSYTWSGAPVGFYNLTAKVTDNNNGVTTSSTVGLTVTTLSGSGWSVTGNNGINQGTNFLGSKNEAPVIFKTFDQERMRILSNGRVLIKTTTSPAADADLAVNGNIYAKKLKVTQLNWADFVFDSTYKLMSLAEVEKYISQHKHLPDVPSAGEIEKNGLSVGDQHAVLLRKVEELTLYVIEQQKQIDELKKLLSEKKAKVSKN